MAEELTSQLDLSEDRGMTTSEETPQFKVLFYGQANTVNKVLTETFTAVTGRPTRSANDPLQSAAFDLTVKLQEEEKAKIFLQGIIANKAARLLLLKYCSAVVFCLSEKENDVQDFDLISELGNHLNQQGYSSDAPHVAFLLAGSQKENLDFTKKVTDEFSKLGRPDQSLTFIKESNLSVALKEVLHLIL